MVSERPMILQLRNLKDPNLVRAGAIPYLRCDDGLYFLFAIDHDYRTLIDFGGHRDPEDFDLLETIRREIREETYDSLGPFEREDLLSCLSFRDDGNLEILLPLKDQLDHRPDRRDLISSRIEAALQKAAERGEALESIGVVWIPADRFFEILFLSPESASKLIYPKVWQPLSQLVDSDMMR